MVSLARQPQHTCCANFVEGAARAQGTRALASIEALAGQDADHLALACRSGWRRV